MLPSKYLHLDSIRSLQNEISPVLLGTELLRRQRLDSGSPIIADITEEIRNAFQQLVTGLRSADLREAICEGCVTFGLIKPRLTNWGKETLRGLKEDEAVGIIMNDVKESLNIVCAHNMIWDKAIFRRFREANREKLTAHSSTLGYNNAWEEEVALMTANAVTPMLLQGDAAMQKWRDMIGHANPTKACTQTIRGKYAFSSSNNLVHGASAVDYDCPVRTLLHEIGCWADNVDAMIR
ncbi:hypothetical protein KA119_00385 [Candidatus Gracilibacteria bacterium]|nr:hypothetical protein [Candidatus Gracilibacteria bacterium]